MPAYPKNPPLQNGKPEKGQTRYTALGNIEYKDPNFSSWYLAVRLDRIRHNLLEETDALGSYTYPRRSGLDEHDKTAFLPADKNFSEERSKRPDTLFQIRPHEDRSSAKPVEMMYRMFDERMVVLDPYNHPVRDFPGELPVTLSTQISGAEIEYYLRKNSEINLYDLMARMMGNYRNSKGNQSYAPIKIKTLSERATKFRRLAALPSWNAPAGSELIEDFLKHALGPDATTTKSLSGDFTMENIIELEDIIKASRLEKEKTSSNHKAESLTLEEGNSSTLDQGVTIENSGLSSQQNSPNAAQDNIVVTQSGFLPEPSGDHLSLDQNARKNIAHQQVIQASLLLDTENKSRSENNTNVLTSSFESTPSSLPIASTATMSDSDNRVPSEGRKRRIESPSPEATEPSDAQSSKRPKKDSSSPPLLEQPNARFRRPRQSNDMYKRVQRPIQESDPQLVSTLPSANINCLHERLGVRSGQSALSYQHNNEREGVDNGIVPLAQTTTQSRPIRGIGVYNDLIVPTAPTNGYSVSERVLDPNTRGSTTRDHPQPYPGYRVDTPPAPRVFESGQSVMDSSQESRRLPQQQEEESLAHRPRNGNFVRRPDRPLDHDTAYFAHGGHRGIFQPIPRNVDMGAGPPNGHQTACAEHSGLRNIDQPSQGIPYRQEQYQHPDPRPGTGIDPYQRAAYRGQATAHQPDNSDRGLIGDHGAIGLSRDHSGIHPYFTTSNYGEASTAEDDSFLPQYPALPTDVSGGDVGISQQAMAPEEAVLSQPETRQSLFVGYDELDGIDWPIPDLEDPALDEILAGFPAQAQSSHNEYGEGMTDDMLLDETQSRDQLAEQNGEGQVEHQRLDDGHLDQYQQTSLLPEKAYFEGEGPKDGWKALENLDRYERQFGPINPGDFELPCLLPSRPSEE